MTLKGMHKIIKPVILSAGIMGLVACDSPQDQDGNNAERVVEAFHETVLTLDTHVDISPDYTLKPEYDPGMRTSMKVDLPKMRDGGLDAAFFIVYVGQTWCASAISARFRLAIFRPPHRGTMCCRIRRLSSPAVFLWMA